MEYFKKSYVAEEGCKLGTKKELSIIIFIDSSFFYLSLNA